MEMMLGRQPYLGQTRALQKDLLGILPPARRCPEQPLSQVCACTKPYRWSHKLNGETQHAKSDPQLCLRLLSSSRTDTGTAAPRCLRNSLKFRSSCLPSPWLWLLSSSPTPLLSVSQSTFTPESLTNSNGIIIATQLNKQ